MDRLSVRRIDVVGRMNIRPLVRTDEMKTLVRGNREYRSCIAYHTEKGVFYGRIGDLKDIPLGATLNPNGHRQAFVHEQTLRAAEIVLNDNILPKLTDPDARFHHYLFESALEKPQFAVPADPIDFAHLPFGLNRSEVMFMNTINRGGDWKATPVGDQLFPFEDFPMSPAAQVLHYAQSIFEGGKAFRYSDGTIVAFRLQDNAVRFMKSAARVALTPVPEEVFLAAIRATVLANRELVAPPGLGAAMYLRPYQFGSGPQLGVAPAPSETFGVFVSPVGPYFKGGFAANKMKVEIEFRRSAPGLMGSNKVSANYAGSIVPGLAAKASGHIRLEELGSNASAKMKALVDCGYVDEFGRMKAFDNNRESLDLKGIVSKDDENEVFEVLTHSHYAEVIYLDARHGKYLEEVGAANAFFIKDGVLYTPKLGSILPGITRDSVITLAKDLGIKVIDNRRLPVDMLMKADEVFCTGTAAVISPIGSVTLNDKTAVYNNGKVGPITQRLYDTLVGIQEGRLPDTHGWIYRLEEPQIKEAGRKTA